MADPTTELGAALAWLALGEQVFQRGQALWNELKPILTAHGIEADDTVLDKIIANAAIREEQAKVDAGLPPGGPA